jgi:hypothetical protein
VAASNSPFKAVYQLVGCLINFSRIGISIKGDGDVFFIVDVNFGYGDLIYFPVQVLQEGSLGGIYLILGRFCRFEEQVSC